MKTYTRFCAQLELKSLSFFQHEKYMKVKLQRENKHKFYTHKFLTDYELIT
jgi:hypothetical protein